jgi:hypothetical protein
LHKENPGCSKLSISASYATKAMNGMSPTTEPPPVYI